MRRVVLYKFCINMIIALVAIYFSAPTFLNTKGDKVSLGLDLKGGAYISIEVMQEEYFKEQFQKYADVLKHSLKQYVSTFSLSAASPEESYMSIHVADLSNIDDVRRIIKSELGSIMEVRNSGDDIRLTWNKDHLQQTKHSLMNQMIQILSRRLNEHGAKEISLQKQGYNFILLQIPGLEDASQVQNVIGKTAKLSLHLVNPDNVLYNVTNSKRLPMADNPEQILSLDATPCIGGDMLVDAMMHKDEFGRAVVFFRLNNVGASIFAKVTSENINRRLAIVLDDKVLSAPVITEPILGGQGTISGHFTEKEAIELSVLLRAGALPVPLKIVEERMVGASLGADSIEAGVRAVKVGFAGIILLMLFYYKLFGLAANIGLLCNLTLIISTLVLFDATLTLPGIAGILVTLGMAVDANILVFERIKDEIKKGRKSVIGAIETGYKLAFSAIIDANITTVAAGLLLYHFGSGPIKGFGLTLSIGIGTSMFSAIIFTKSMIILYYRMLKPSKLLI